MKTSAIGGILFIAGIIIVIVSFASMDTTYATFSMQKFSLILVSAMFGWLLMIVGAVMFLHGLKFKKVKT